MEAATNPTGRRFESEGVPIADLRFDDLDCYNDTIRSLTSGVQAVATARRGFRSRIRAWSLAGEPFFAYASANGSAVFEESRDYGAVTIPLSASFRARVGSREFNVHDGQLQVLAPDVRGELEPGGATQLLGVAMDWASFTKHRQAVAGAGIDLGPVPATPLSSLSEQGCGLLRYVNRLCREVNETGSLLHDDRVAKEAVDTIKHLLAETLHAAQTPGPGEPDEIVYQRAQAFLAESLDSPVTLSEAATIAGTSTRSLSRAFERRRGMGPMAFRRQRRFEAAYHDLFVADCHETSVTEVARRYCFDHLGRFAVQYRALFGESPSETLRG